MNLRYVTLNCIMLQYPVSWSSVLHCVKPYYSVLHCVKLCYDGLHCVLQWIFNI